MMTDCRKDETIGTGKDFEYSKGDVCKGHKGESSKGPSK
jgi:hypothetical protein